MKIRALIFALAMTASLGVHADAGSQKKEAESIAAHIDLAASYFEAGRNDIAAEELQKILAKDSKNAQANDLMGLINLKAGNTAEAANYFKAAINGDPSNFSAYSNYGLLLCKSGHYDEGMDAFGKALMSTKNTHPSQTLVNGGICLEQKGDLTGAEKFLIKALEQEPFMPSALYQLSQVYYATQRYDQAESRLSALYQQVAPNAATTYLQYKIAQAQGKSSQARALAEIMQTRFAQSPEAKQIQAN